MRKWFEGANLMCNSMYELIRFIVHQAVYYMKHQTDWIDLLLQVVIGLMSEKHLFSSM